MAILFPAALDNYDSLFEVVNNGKTYVNGAMASSGGNNGQNASIDLIDGSVFPTTAGFILIGTELLSYSSRVANKLIGITRAYDGTTAAAHQSGSLVRMVVMAEYHNILVDAIIAIETAMGVSGSGNFPRRYSQATDPTLDPGNAVADGDLWLDTGSGQVFVRAFGEWKTIA